MSKLQTNLFRVGDGNTHCDLLPQYNQMQNLWRNYIKRQKERAFNEMEKFRSKIILSLKHLLKKLK